MCGIIGKYSNKIIDKNLIKDQLEMTSRRGPDNSGFWISENQNLGLGSNRLSIQDISSQANMPFISKDKRLVIVFNGEIYNYRILQKQLINLGYEFVTNSDTEVILNLYKEYGKKCVNKLEGMFAFCIYDKNRNSLFLARDISGQKPLYYYTNENIFSFSSHLNQLILDIDITKKINHSALYNYLIYGYSLSGETLIDGIQKLEPGNYLELNLNNLNLKKHSYWEIDNEKNLINDEDKVLNLLDKKLNASVKNHLISDRSTGILLSGGIDSSLIAYYSAINSNKKINTYNVTFKNFPNYDESKYAKQISSFIDTNHFEINGDDVTDYPIYLRTKKFKVGYVPQYGGYFNDLTLEDNLKAIAEIVIENKILINEKVNYLVNRFEKIVSLLLILYFPNLDVISIFSELANLINAFTSVRNIISLFFISISPVKALIVYSLPLLSFAL